MVAGQAMGNPMTSFEIVVASTFRSLSTRENGAQARQTVIEALATHQVVTLNFLGAHPSPSFADELIGRLASDLGESIFRQRMRITGIGDAERSLFQYVVSQRLRRAAQQIRRSACAG